MRLQNYLLTKITKSKKEEEVFLNKDLNKKEKGGLMKHSPFATLKNGDLIQAVPFFDHPLNELDPIDEDSENEDEINFPFETVLHHYSKDTKDEEFVYRWSIIRFM